MGRKMLHEIVDRAYWLPCEERFDGPNTKNRVRLHFEMRDGSHCQGLPGILDSCDYRTVPALADNTPKERAEWLHSQAHTAAREEDLLMRDDTPVYFRHKKFCFNATEVLHKDART